MDEERETKAVSEDFHMRSDSGSTLDDFDRIMRSIEDIFENCDKTLKRAGISETGYVSQKAKISEVINDISTLSTYVCFAYDQVYSALDHPLYEGFANGATETLSWINLDNIVTENTFNMEEHYRVRNMVGIYSYDKRVKSKLRMSDFMGLVEWEAKGGMPTLENMETVGIFADLFRMDYEALKPEDMDINTYLEAVLKRGEFEHKGYHPVKDFVSAVADATIILPLVESIIGYDFITGEDLTDMERILKGGGAALDLITLGSSGILTDLAEAGLWAAVKMGAKSMAVDALGNGVGYLVSEGLQDMGYSAGASALLSALATGTVTYAAGKYLFKNAVGEVVGEYSGEELSRILKDELGHSPDIPKVKGEKINSLLDNTGIFTDETLENNYQTYVKRKIKEGKVAKDRLEWKTASDYWTKESPVARGNNFNKTVREAEIYDYHEIYLENGKRLDSYDPDAGEIISRKATDLDQITEETYRKYLSEFSEKYSEGTKIRSNAYPELDEQELAGQYILEIPAQNAELSNIDYYKDIASEYNVILRFTEEVK